MRQGHRMRRDSTSHCYHEFNPRSGCKEPRTNIPHVTGVGCLVHASMPNALGMDVDCCAFDTRFSSFGTDESLRVDSKACESHIGMPSIYPLLGFGTPFILAWVCSSMSMRVSFPYPLRLSVLFRISTMHLWGKTCPTRCCVPFSAI